MARDLPSSGGLITALTALALLLSAAAAPPTPQDLAIAERTREAALAVQRAAQARAAQQAAEQQLLAAARIAAAARLQATEQALDQAARRTAALARQRDEAAALLHEDAQALAPLLPLMQRLSRYPAETLLAAPGTPADRVRGLLLIRAIANGIRARAQAVLAEQQALAAAQVPLDSSLPGLRAAQDAQRAQAAALDGLIDQARQARQRAEAEGDAAAGRAQLAAARAGSLRAAIASLAEAAARTTPPGRHAAPVAITSRPGDWPPPVAGRVARAFGAPGDAGPASGVTFAQPPGARVVASCSGRVAFAAPFRSYGRLAIIDCGGGLHLVLAGLGRLDVAAGQPVRAGEPVGVMPGWDPVHPGGSPPGLYLEVRKNGEAVNPSQYLRAGP